MALPLQGVFVLDLTNVLAGPFCTYQLAIAGADVLKIEQPKRGDLSRSLGADPVAAAKGNGASFVSVNAGKQSMTLNLKHPEGKKVLKRLVERADVLVENFRPGVMDRLELGYAALAAVNAALVYCAISGFGSDGPLAQRPAYDQIIQGIAGVMSVTGYEDSDPLRVGYPICDTTGGLMAAFAISAALVDARGSGRGRFIDVSMLESTLSTMGWVVSNYLNAGVVPHAMGNENFTAAPSGAFRTGKGVLNIAANEDKQYEVLCDVLERPGLKTDARFNNRQLRKANRALLLTEIEDALAGKSAEEWEKRLTAAGVPAGCILTIPEILEHEHLRARQFVLEFESAAGTQRVTRSGFQFADDSAAPRKPAPILSMHTREWLERLGYDEASIRKLQDLEVI